jgi:rhamnogalacturonyl hydrolase YesR
MSSQLHVRTHVAVGILLGLFSAVGCSYFTSSSPASLSGNWIQKKSFTGPAEDVVVIMDSVRTYHLARRGEWDSAARGWEQCAFYVGMIDAYRSTGQQKYWASTLDWARGNDWQLGSRKQHADDQCAGQVYLDLVHIAGTGATIPFVKPTKRAFDPLVKRSINGADLWWWADALFMAPPGLVRLSNLTGRDAYTSQMVDLFWEATGPLFDAEAGLYYRDEKYVGRRNENGKKVFWSRGNGWVMAGLARILAVLPRDHPSRDRFVTHFRRMAEAVAGLQQPSGYWRPSLYDPEAYPTPETSGTGFFCYALAWGINEGLLDRGRYAPVVERAWTALADAVRANGRLQWVQPVGEAPATVDKSDTAPYGAGALLMAGSEVTTLADTGLVFSEQR